MNAKLDIIPNREESELARASAEALGRLMGQLPELERARVSLDGNEMILPRQALALLREVLAEMAQGNAVTIVPTHAELTTQEAANFLNVSRPHIVKLLEQNVIPFSKTGTHRRVRYQDLVNYRNEQIEQSQRTLDKLAAEAQELGLGY
jgi:excisionase family DNA binding protein